MKNIGLRLIYKGTSMNPRLKNGDCINVAPYQHRKISLGDVVVFRHPEEKHYIAHRVVSVNSLRVKTQGDNNYNIDPWILNPDDIIGRVISIKRGEKSIILSGGLQGRILALAIKLKKRVAVKIYKTIRPICHFLARSIIFRKWVPHWMRTRVIYFQRPKGIELQFLLGQRLIARCLPGKHQWQIRSPFRLFVDTSFLKDKSRN